MVEVLERVERVEPPVRDRVPSVVDALLCPDETAEFVASMRPGADATVALSVLDPVALTHSGRVDALVGVRRAQAWLASLEHGLLAAMAGEVVTRGDERDPSGLCWLAEEVACALRLAPATADDRIRVATELTRRLPATLTALAGGEITGMHAVVLAESVAGLDDEQVAAVQGRVLPRAGGQAVGEFRRAVRRAVLRVDARREEQRHSAAVAERRVVVSARDDGMAELWALLPADGAAIVLAAITRWATKAPVLVSEPDGRLIDQRRADALVELALAGLNGAWAPRAVKPAVQITVGLATLLGDNDHPADLDGFGPIPASMARRIAADPSGTWRRLITDEAGRLLDHRTRCYRPPTDLARRVRARDQRCVMPGCGRRATSCEVDHRTPYPAGPTNLRNLESLCKRHHDLKHHSDWQLDKDPDGTYVWATPTRHTYRYRPAELPPPGTEPEPDAGIEPIPTAKIDDEPPPF